jgi:hypothetical protein
MIKKFLEPFTVIVALVALVMLLPKDNNNADAQSTTDTSVLTNMESPNTLPLLNNMLRQQSQATQTLQGYFNSNGLLSVSAGGTGVNLGSCAQGSVSYFSATGVMACLAPGTSGQVLQTQGASANPQWYTISQVWVPNNIQVFTSSGTWIKPSNISNVYVKVIGGGGGGANDDGSGDGGFCGGGGGYSEGYVSVNSNVTVTIGSGGASRETGNTGGTSSFAASGGTIQATGGSGGVQNPGGSPGNGGTGSGGNINIPGQTNGTSGLSYGGVGGTGYGGGGHAPNVSPPGSIGGSGTAGIVIVYY